MNTFNSKLRLQLLADKKLQRRSGKGFTLIELMVTVATLGVLGATAFPAFQGAQARAKAGSMVGSLNAWAKECATNAITGNATALSATDITITGSGTGATANDGDCSVGATVKNTTAFPDPTKIGGLVCIADPADGASGGDDVCTITVGTDGSLTGAWS